MEADYEASPATPGHWPPWSSSPAPRLRSRVLPVRCPLAIPEILERLDGWLERNAGTANCTCDAEVNWRCELCCDYQMVREARTAIYDAHEFIRTVAWRAGCWSEQDTLANVADFFGVTVEQLEALMEKARNP